MSFNALAQKSLLNALYGSQEKINISNIDPDFEKDKTKSGTTSKNTSVSCTSDQQTSLPLRFVLGLLRGKGAMLEPSYDATSNKLSVYGGPMIGNCNSMLEYYWGEPEDGVPYTFEVRIKKPANCVDNKCKYSVQTMKDEKVVNLDEEIEVAPTMDGFVECLEKTGVYKDGGIVKENIVTTEFSAEKKNGINKSGEVWFASRGPAALNSGGGVFDEKNKYNENACYFYEDIKKDGYIAYTKRDIQNKNLMDKVESLCNSDDYAEIYGNLNNYKNFSSTYRDLEKVMQKQLLKEVAKAKKEFKEAVEKGDLSELDTEKYAKLFKDFNDLIIQKHLDEDSHNAADEDNMNLLVNLYTAWENAEDEDEKKRLEKKMRDIQKGLNEYLKEPYFTLDDYAHFLSMKKKAPLKDPKWKDATITLHKALLSLKLSCQAYSVDNSDCSFSDKSNNMKDMATIENINSKVAGYNKKAKSKYEQREYVLKNPDADNSEDFEDLIADCEKLFKEAGQKQQYWMRTRGQYNQVAQQQCRNKNPYMNMFQGYGGYYRNKFTQCVQDMNADYKRKFKVNSSQVKVCSNSIDTYKSEYSKWRELEDLRDKYYYSDGDDDTEDNTTVTSNNDDSYNFQFTPGQMQMPNRGFQMPQQFDPRFQMTQPGTMPGMYDPRMYSMSRFGGNNGLGFNFGWGGGNTMGYRNPAVFGGPQYGYGGPQFGGPQFGGPQFVGGGMSAPMAGYMNNMSSPMGAYNFTFGGGQGVQLI